MFAIPLRRPDLSSVVKGLILIFTRHACISNTILTDRGTAPTAEVVKQTMEQAGASIKNATIKNALTIGMVERNQQKLKTVFKINISAEQPPWEQCLNITVMVLNTTYHASLNSARTEFLHGRTPHSELDCKFANLICLAKQPTNRNLEDINRGQRTIPGKREQYRYSVPWEQNIFP